MDSAAELDRLVRDLHHRLDAVVGETDLGQVRADLDRLQAELGALLLEQRRADRLAARVGLAWRVGTAFGLGARIKEWLGAVRRGDLLPVAETTRLAEALVNRWLGATLLPVITALATAVTALIILVQVVQFQRQNELLTEQVGQQAAETRRQRRLDQLGALYDIDDERCVFVGTGGEPGSAPFVPRCAPKANSRIRRDALIAFVEAERTANASPPCLSQRSLVIQAGDLFPFQVDVREAALVGVDLTKADLRCVSFVGSDLRKSRFINSSLNRSNLAQADLTEADLTSADLTMANLRDAYTLEDYSANFNSATLVDVDFKRVKLNGSNFAYAVISESDLTDAKFRFADFMFAALDGADLKGTDLRGARNLVCPQLTKAKNWQDAYRDIECGAPIPVPAGGPGNQPARPQRPGP